MIILGKGFSVSFRSLVGYLILVAVIVAEVDSYAVESVELQIRTEQLAPEHCVIQFPLPEDLQEAR